MNRDPQYMTQRELEISTDLQEAELDELLEELQERAHKYGGDGL